MEIRKKPIKDVEIIFDREGVRVRQTVESILEPVNIEKQYSYQEIEDKDLCIIINKIEPVLENGLLKKIKIFAQPCYTEARFMGVEKVCDLDSCIRWRFPNARGQTFRDLKAVIGHMIEDKCTREGAVKKVAMERGVTTSTVHSNITRGLGISVDELDRRIEEVLQCLKDCQLI